MLTVRRGLLDEVLERFFVEHAGVDRPFVQLAEGQKGREGDAAVPGLERKILKQGEKEGGRFFVKLRVSVTTEYRGPRTLDRILQPERGFHDTGLRRATSELG